MEPEIAAPTPSREPAQVELIHQEDHLLQTLVDYINDDHDGRLGITLQMKGLLVTGTVIAGDNYFKQFADNFASKSINEDVAEANRKIFMGYGDRYREGRENKDKEKTGKTGYIHMQDCEFVTPDGITSVQALWRGKIAEVDGFFMGRLGRQQPAPKPE